MSQEKQRERVKYMHGAFVGKSTDLDTGDTLLRYFFTSDNMDEGGDIITREATEEATKRWRDWRNIRLQHNPMRPIGKAVRMGSADDLEWNQMDVRVDDPDVLPLVKGDDPVLGGASVGIMVTAYETNDDEEAIKRAGPWWDPWIITEYDFVEISLVDHPANYDAKRVGEVEAERSRLLFMRRDLLDPVTKEVKENPMTKEEIQAPVEKAAPVEEPVITDTAPIEKGTTEEPLVELGGELPTAAPEAEVVPEEGGDPDPTLVALGEIKSMLTAINDGLMAKMNDIHEVIVPVAEQEKEVVAPAAELEEAPEELGAPVEDTEEREPETPEPEADPIAVLSRMVEQIYEKVFGTEAGDEEVETDEPTDLKAMIEQAVEEQFQARLKLQPRKSTVVGEEPAPTADEKVDKDLNPRENLRAEIHKAFRPNEV